MNTLGDHLRKVRLDRGLSQPDVAKILKVTTDSVTGWELNWHSPTSKFAKSLIEFLGYVPFTVNEASLGKRLRLARLMSGMTQKEAADLIGCDASILRQIELDKRKPGVEMRRKIEEYIRAVWQI